MGKAVAALLAAAALGGALAAVATSSGSEGKGSMEAEAGATTSVPRHADTPPPPAAHPTVRWRRSEQFGLPSAGALRGGVKVPFEGKDFFTWDPIRRTSPNRGWRRWGTDGVVRITLRVIREFRRAHPAAPRIGIGDLSRPHGGDFGPRFGLPGHASHQNGLDVDLYYPRRDRRERAPTRVEQLDLTLSQDLVDRFVRAGAEDVFVGPNTGLVGPPGVVAALPHHDNHLHVRFPGRLA